MQIELKGKIGCIAFVLKARADIAENLVKLAQAALKQIAYHDSASTVFKADSGFTRDSAYSPELASLVEATFKAKLEAVGFSDISFTSLPYVKPTPFSVFEKAMKGLPADVIASTWAIHPNNPANKPQPAKAEVKAEPAQSAPVSLS
jgi:hypothetical protein